MSIENVESFFKKIGGDQSLAEKVKEAGTDLSAFIKLGKENGCDFTGEDLKDYNEKAGIKVEEELSDDQLEKVAGGIGLPTIPGLENVVSMATSAVSMATSVLGGHVSVGSVEIK